MADSQRHMSVAEIDFQRALALVDRSRGCSTYGPGEKIIDEVFHPIPVRKAVHTVSEGRCVFVFKNPSDPQNEAFDRKDGDAYDHYQRKFAEAGIESRFFTVRYL